MKVHSHVHAVVVFDKKDTKIVSVYYDRSKAERHADGLIKKLYGSSNLGRHTHVAVLKLSVGDSMIERRRDNQYHRCQLSKIINKMVEISEKYYD